MKNRERVLSKTVAPVYTAKPSHQLTPYAHMRSMTEHRIKRGVAKLLVGVKSFGVVKSKSKIATETRRSQSYYFSVFSAPPRLIFFVKNQTILQSQLLEKFIKFNTYGFAIRKPLRKVYQKPLRRFTSQTRMPTGIRKPLRKVYQTTGMRSIPEHHVNRGIGLRGYCVNRSFGLRGHRIKRGVAL